MPVTRRLRIIDVPEVRKSPARGDRSRPRNSLINIRRQRQFRRMVPDIARVDYEIPQRLILETEVIFLYVACPEILALTNRRDRSAAKSNWKRIFNGDVRRRRCIERLRNAEGIVSA